MGYTHYWERPKVLPRPQFLAAVEDCRRMCSALSIPLGDSGGEGHPMFADAEICFNGRADSSGDYSCETFRIERIRKPRHSR